MRMIRMSLDVYDTYVEANPTYEKYLNKKIDMYDEMAIVVGNDIARGSGLNTTQHRLHLLPSPSKSTYHLYPHPPATHTLPHRLPIHKSSHRPHRMNSRIEIERRERLKPFGFEFKDYYTGPQVWKMGFYFHHKNLNMAANGPGIGANNFHDDGVDIKNLSLDTESSETWNPPTSPSQWLIGTFQEYAGFRYNGTSMAPDIVGQRCLPVRWDILATGWLPTQ
ncbi:hypothetical protein Cgig2_028635 [Carnegiea gigantea]|uniref:Uncharacterized protein n=1 Tax=Carnegiea gigantea TaxID=171969 RepID=A0A9Q1JEW2_9CARY|nr:hypothetical protein Cgig2_028635 [Carnegiea gigantea]